MTNQDWKLIFAEDIVINFTFKKNGIEMPLEYKFKQPTEDAQLELMSGITNLEKLTDYVSKKDVDLEAMGGMEEKELLAQDFSVPITSGLAILGAGIVGKDITPLQRSILIVFITTGVLILALV